MTTLSPTVGMPLARLLARAPEGDALIDGDVLADLGGLADDHPRSVVDEQPFAESGSRVDLDAGEQTSDLRHQAWGPRAPRAARGRSAARWNHRACRPG